MLSGWKNLLILVVVCSASFNCLAKTHQRLVDPFFQIQYDPAKVHFEPIPVQLMDRCRGLRDRYIKGWVYSHVSDRKKQYFIIYGYIKIPSPERPGGFSTVLEDDDGVIVAFEGSTCVIDQWQFFLRNQANPAKGATPIEAPESIRETIAAELLERYARAFGGKERFLHLVTRDARKGLPPVLQKRLEIFEKRR
jgi:hypothetical protein